jgi:signal transduction histidine kinase
MSDETLSKLFEPYYTTKANGTGLGMAMVYKIVKEFSGEITVDSKEGQGTAFILSFPIPQKDVKLLSSEGQ